MPNTIDELFLEFVFAFENSSLLPKELKSKLGTNAELWQYINDCNFTILKLLVRKVMKKEKIDLIVEEFDEKVSHVCQYITKKDQIRLAMYWLHNVRTMNERCLQEDQFEACANIKKFTDLYFLAALNDDE